MIDYGKRNLLGVGIDAVDYDAAVQRIISAAKHSEQLGVSALAVHGVMTGVIDREHCFRLNQLELVVPDGQPVRWGINLVHRLKLTDRVYGPNLMLRVCAAAEQQSLPIFVFGSDAETLTKLIDSLRSRFPRLEIAGFRPSLFRRLSAAELEDLMQEIKSSGAKMTLVGIGCPRQEVWAFELRERLSMPILAVGAAFAFHAGRMSQAPTWMQSNGLEWLYRLCCEPVRLWKRYALMNPAYLGLLALQRLKVLTLRSERGVEPTEECLYG